MVFKESSNLTEKNEFENRRVEKAIGKVLSEMTADHDCLVPPKEVNEEIASPPDFSTPPHF